MNAFKENRLRMRLKQGEMAKILGCSNASLSFIEHGRRVPPIETAKKFIAYCKTEKIKVTLDEIYKDVQSNLGESK